MTKSLGKKLAVLLSAAVLAGSFTGCGLLQNTEIVFTTGLSGNQLFKIGKSVCTLPESMIYVMDYQRQYEGVYGVEMWEHDFGGVTFMDSSGVGLILGRARRMQATEGQLVVQQAPDSIKKMLDLARVEYQ